MDIEIEYKGFTIKCYTYYEKNANDIDIRIQVKELEEHYFRTLDFNTELFQTQLWQPLTQKYNDYPFERYRDKLEKIISEILKKNDYWNKKRKQNRTVKTYTITGHGSKVL